MNNKESPLLGKTASWYLQYNLVGERMAFMERRRKDQNFVFCLVLHSVLSQLILSHSPEVVRVTPHIFTEGESESKCLALRCRGTGTAGSKDTGLSPAPLQVTLPTCSLPGYRFSAHVGFPLISWQVHASPGPFPVRKVGIRFGVTRCTQFPCSRPSGLSSQNKQRPATWECGAVLLPRKALWDLRETLLPLGTQAILGLQILDVTSTDSQAWQSPGKPFKNTDCQLCAPPPMLNPNHSG